VAAVAPIPVGTAAAGSRRMAFAVGASTAAAAAADVVAVAEVEVEAAAAAQHQVLSPKTRDTAGTPIFAATGCGSDRHHRGVTVAIESRRLSSFVCARGGIWNGMMTATVRSSRSSRTFSYHCSGPGFPSPHRASSVLLLLPGLSRRLPFSSVASARKTPGSTHNTPLRLFRRIPPPHRVPRPRLGPQTSYPPRLGNAAPP
jgi:hypothetical protein